MRTPLVSHLAQIWFQLRYSYWFVPAVMMAASVALAFAMIAIDRGSYGGFARQLAVAYEGGPDGAREVLSVIAGSMITVAGVVFSITVVALQLASSQFGPRILRNFMRDRGNQFVLGTFVSTFIFSLLILRTIRSPGDQVPALSVSVAVLLAIVSLAVLIYYIHHAAVSIQAPEIVRTIGEELIETIDRLYPEQVAEAVSKQAAEARSAEAEEAYARTHVLEMGRAGYIQSVDESLLMRLACEHDLQIELVQRPGMFATPHACVMRISAARDLDAHVQELAREAVSLGSARTHEQDVLFATEQLVEVAIRSLSPGINDPFTAMSCVDWLGVALIRRLRRVSPEEEQRDPEGRTRLVVPSVSLNELLDVSYGRLRTYGASHPTVVRTMIETLQASLEHAPSEADRDSIARHVQYIMDAAEREINDPVHLKRLRAAAGLA